MISLDNLNYRTGITPNFSDLPEVQRPAGIGARPHNQTLALPAMLAEADLQKKAWRPLRVTVLKLRCTG